MSGGDGPEPAAADGSPPPKRPRLAERDRFAAADLDDLQTQPDEGASEVVRAWEALHALGPAPDPSDAETCPRPASPELSPPDSGDGAGDEPAEADRALDDADDADSPVVGPQLPPTAEASSPGPGSQWAKEQLPPPRGNELEFLIKDPTSYKQGKSIHSPIQVMNGGAFRFRLLVFPMGTENTGKPEQVAAFVEAVPPDDCQEVRWAYEGVKYQISVVNWHDYRCTKTQADTFTFQRDSADRGWHRGFVKASEMSASTGWLSEDGELCLRAACCTRRALVQITASAAACRRNAGYVGLKNHGATCYMNCLLQTLFHIGRFRQIVYCIDCDETSEQAAGSGDEALSGADDRPAQPLLIALQNLFHRLQTSDAPVSCRELMRSFGWDTADAFMQHDAQELNRLLCDRLEEQMKGTSMDGAIKRLFEGEMENYIECVDVDYRSQRLETFYDLQLNVRNDAGKDLLTLEESLRDFTSEETLEGDNAYDAGDHGKQRARKGCRFKRFPPVLYIQLKRFMFDAERMDMCKLNGRLEFPQVLDLEAFAPGSGKYMLHTVVIHSGGVSSGHYYAFVRVPDGSEGGGFRWVKFDDEQVVACSEQAAVEDNYGGEDPMIWNYFHLPPDELCDHPVPMAPRIHNAYMLSYVRSDLAQEILKPSTQEGEEKNFQRTVERCAREARLADERRRARSEQLQRININLVLERDLMGLEDFWNHQAVPCSLPLRMSRDQMVQELINKVEEQVDVPYKNIALFLLHIRLDTKQQRFKHLPPGDRLRQHMPQHGGAPHSAAVEQQMIILCVLSRGYDPHTLEWSKSAQAPHEISNWTDEICLLIIKYFCPEMQRLVTLGCYYNHIAEPIEAMISGPENWLADRLQPFVEKKQVAPLRPDAQLLCWEEFGYKHPKDFLERNIYKSLDKEGLSNGDILIWQPAVPPLRQRSPASPASDGNDSTKAPELADEDSDCPARTVRDFAMALFSQVNMVVRLHPAEAPWCPEGVLADGRWGARALEDSVPEGPMPPGVPREAQLREFTADVRWRLSSFTTHVVKAFDLAEEVTANGRSVWLFDRGPPAAIDDPPVFRTEAHRSPRTDRPLAELLASSASVMAAQQGWAFHAVLLPQPPEEAPSGSRPVAVHFFDASVREVGACVLHVADADPDAEVAAHEDDRDSESGLDAALPTGRPALDPAEVLELARRYLEQPGNEQLLARFQPPAPASRRGPVPDRPPKAPPLRLVDVARGRVGAVYRAGDGAADGDTDGPRVWPARGANFFAAALRVEPDCDGEDRSPASGEAPAVQTELVEVYHAEPHSGQPFGHPFLLRVSGGEQATVIARRLQDKLDVGEAEVRHWKLLRVDDDHRAPLEEADVWPVVRTPPSLRGLRPTWSPSAPAFCIERLHPVHRARSPSGALRLPRTKALTIKAR